MMKFVSKRILAWLLSLAMLVSLISGMSLLPVQADTVVYKYNGSYVYNWGERDELATFLSPMAEDWYADKNVTYEDLAAYSGASSTSGVPDSALFGELHELMYSNLDSPTSYNDTRYQFQYTDCENSGGSISSFYSGKAIGPSWDGGATWNREHTWPNSKSNGGGNSNTQRETDIMMLRPASVSENSSRSNTAYGEGSKFYDPNELGQNVRGDCARIVLYVYVCWGGSSFHDGALNYMWGSAGVIESKDILLKWMEEDPVDTWELGRNDAVQAIIGTRNVFVDYPELAFELFNEEVPAGYDSPSGGSTAVSYEVSASTNNSNYGTVAVKGSTITATPNTGYAVSGYTILSGTATVTRDGNTFKVTPTSDVSIRINFAKRSQATVQFSQLSNVVGSETAYTGDAITLPDHSGAVPSGYTFIGWSENVVEETATKPAVYAAGGSFTVSANTVLYAVYSRFEENGSGGNVYSLYSGAITEGDYVIVYNKDDYKNQAMIAEDTGSTRLNFKAISYANGNVVAPDAMAVWHIAPNSDYWTLYNEETGTYAGSTGTKSQAKPVSSVTDNALWKVTGNDTYDFVNKANTTKGINASLRRNGDYGFACYAASFGGALTLYKRVSGSTYYFTGAACEHTYDNDCDTSCNRCGAVRTIQHAYDNACDADCNVCGAVRTTQHTYDNACDATCNACGAIRTPASHVYDNACDATCNVCGTTRTPAAHVYDNACDATCNVCGASRTVADHVCTSQVTTAATCGKAGVRTYTCVVCGHSYTESIPATGAHTYAGDCDADCNVCGATRTPAAHTYTADCDTICNVCGAERTVSVGGQATITFDNTSKRTEFSTTIQVWEENGIIVTNTKSSTSSNVADYADPARFYKNSKLTLDYPGMVKIVFHCNSQEYATNLQKSLGIGSVSDTTVTIELDNVNTFTVTLSGGQVRVDSITVTAAGAEHTYSGDCDATCNACGTVREAEKHSYTATETLASCGTDGVRTYTCAQCGDSYTETIPATGQHTYDDEYDADCNVCGDIREVPEKPADVLYGDANGDGAVNINDVILLQKFIAKWDVSLDAASADANADGSVNINDVILLQKFIAKWDVTLGP